MGLPARAASGGPQRTRALRRTSPGPWNRPGRPTGGSLRGRARLAPNWFICSLIESTSVHVLALYTLVLYYRAMEQVLVIDAVRTPLARRHGGLSGSHPARLLAG